MCDSTKDASRSEIIITGPVIITSYHAVPRDMPRD